MAEVHLDRGSGPPVGLPRNRHGAHRAFRCPPGSDAGQRPPPGELAGAPWRKRVGIEPTIPGTNPESTDLKSAEAARPHALPTERARLSRPVERDPGGADGDRTRDLVNAIHARSQLRHSPNSGPERKGCRSALPRSADFSSQPRFSPRHRPSGRPAVRGSGYLGTSVTV